MCPKPTAIDCKLATDGGRPVRAAIPPLRAADRKEVKVKLNGDANQRIDFIWRRALRVSQTDGELSEQSCAELHDEVLFVTEAIDCKLATDGGRPVRAAIPPLRAAELKDLKAKLNRDDNKRIDLFCRGALRGYRGGLYELPPWRSSAEFRHGGSSRWVGLHETEELAPSPSQGSLEMMKAIYGKTTPHRDIGESLNNIGNSWSHLGDQRKAISYYEQSLKMTKAFYGERTPHPSIAGSLNNIGNCWKDLGDQRKAISFHEQSLEMLKAIYGETTPHPEIA
ncbi:hypothetical protein Bbelb_377120 [Branchiostoma belcheri]|nr:hypothetical protein Bbelb_377120 [Branchiostoma belcheri]